MIDFEIKIQQGNKWYKMQVRRVVEELIDRYYITAGKRSLILQSNIPEIEHSVAKKKISWQILKSDELQNGNEDDRALAIQNIFREIEKKIMRLK